MTDDNLLTASATDEGPDTEWDCQHVHCLNRLARPAVPATDEGRWKMPNVPCCGYKSLDVVRMNPYNGVVQCHNCGITYEPPRPAVPALDVRRVKQAIVNVAKRHGVAPDNPSPVDTYSVASIWGYTRTTPDMDAEIAAEYAALSPKEPTE